MEGQSFEAEELDWCDLSEYAMDFLRRLSPGSPWELLEEVAQDTLVSLHVAAKKRGLFVQKPGCLPC